MPCHPRSAVRRTVHTRGLRRACTVLCGAAACAGVLAVPASADAAQLIVGDDPSTCPAAGYTTIQAAVDAAAPGDTVSVCPGTYVEGSGAPNSSALTIDKSLTLRGAGAGLVTIKPNPAGGGTIANATGGSSLSRFDAIGDVVAVTTSPQAGAPANVDISGVTVTGGSVRVDSGVAFTDATGSLADAAVTGIDAFELGAQEGIGVTAYSDLAAGDLPVALSGVLIAAYNKGGVYASAEDFTTAARSGSRVLLSIDGSRIQGAGRQSDQGQNGVYAAYGSAAAISGSTIADNYFTRDATSGGYSGSVGVLLWDADLGATSIAASNVQGNGYGLANADATGAARTDPVVAQSDWWGARAGPSPDVGGANSEPPVAGDRTQGGVTSTPFLTSPAPYAAAPASPPPAPPSVAITAPTDGATLQPGEPITIGADASDDIAVQSVTFRVGSRVLATDATPPYTASWTPTEGEAGTAQSVIASAQDVSGQTATAASAVQVAALPLTGFGGETPPPPPLEPAPPTPAPGPPSIAIASPAAGTVLRGTVTLSATASAPAGIASVDFYDGTTRICRDTSAPFSCRFAPRGADVGRPTLTATATDRAGQTTSATRTFAVRRFTPRALTARTRVVRARGGRRTTLASTGTLALPAGVSRAAGCEGSVAVTFRSGTQQTVRVAPLARACRFKVSVPAPGARASGGHRQRVRVALEYLGGQALARFAGRAGTVTIR